MTSNSWLKLVVLLSVSVSSVVVVVFVVLVLVGTLLADSSQVGRLGTDVLLLLSGRLICTGNTKR